MAIGRISGPLLKANLLRDGVNLAFETDLLFLDVINGRIGIKTANPTHDLTVNGTTRTTNLEVTTEADIATINIQGNTISSSDGTINLEPSGTNPVVYQGKLQTGDLQLSTNVIETLGTNTDLEIRTTGTGKVNINANVEVFGDLHATGTITADGDINIGDANTDNITFNADINSNIVPNTTNTFDLGTDPATGGKEWRNAYIKDVFANTVNANTITAGGIDLLLEPGNTYFVATTGSDGNTGTHPNDPYLTVKFALTQATAGDTVYIHAGTYQEQFPLTVPAGVTVKGAGIRAVKIVPTLATNNKDCFLLNGETTVEDLTIADYFFDSGNNTGYAFKFASGLTVTSRSPYIRNITVITKGSVTSAGDPYGFDQNDAGKGAYIDGSVANASSKEASMLFHSVTFITPNQETIVATNGVRIEWLNSFTYFADKGIYAYSNAAGFANQGQTRLRIDNQTGTFAVGDTLTYYDTDGTTVLASGTIASKDGNYVNLTGRQLGFQTITDRAGKTVYAQGGAKLSTIIKKFGTASLSLDGSGDYATVPSNPDFKFGPPVRLEKTITVTGDAVVSSAQSKFGGSSIRFDGTGDKLTVASSSDFAFGAGDFTAEAWIYRNTATGAHCIFDFRSASAGNNGILLFTNNNIQYYVGGATRINVATSGTANAWNHVALVRNSGTTNIYLNGTSVGSYVDGQSYTTSTVTIGSYFNNTAYFNGYVDEIRISNTARYTGAFTVPSSAFTPDVSSILLIHGNNDISDDPGISGDFTIECWVYRNVSNLQHNILDFRSSLTQNAPLIYISTTNTLNYYVNGSIRITGTTVSTGAWHHVALSRSGDSTKLYFNGTQVGSTWTDTTDYIQSPLTIGSRFDGLAGNLNGYIDDVRITKGVSKYTSNFAVPTAQLTSDLSTVLLLHFDGTDNSTTFIDDGITFQDIRTTSGGTAQLIDFADYSDFGAEIRSIGSANIYGNYGTYGDGQGVVAYLISQNYAYIGAGKKATNDPNDTIQANEVVELNGAQIYYTSVDNEGNFRVGDSFYVNQKTGDVLFDGQALSVTSLSGITFSDGTNTTTVTATNIDTGNLRISGNTIESLTGDVNVTAASGAINLQNNTFVTGNLDVTGDVTIGGNIQIGDQSSDNINFVGSINSNLVPSTNNTYDLGTTLLRWANVYVNKAEIDGLVIDNNSITTSGNDNLTLDAAGTGKVLVSTSDVEITQNLTVNGTTTLDDVNVNGTITHVGNVNQTGTYTQTGDTEITGSLTVGSYAQFENIKIDGNIISTTIALTDLELKAALDGKIYVPTNDVLFDQDLTVNGVATIGDLNVTTSITANSFSTGDILIDDNYITTTLTNSNLELKANGTGIISVPTNDVEITQDLSVGGDLTVTTGITSLQTTNITGNIDQTGDINQTGNFTTSGLAQVTGNITGTGYLELSDIKISGTLVEVITANTDLQLQGNGTGDVVFENIRVTDNTFKSTQTNQDIVLQPQGSGSVVINSDQSLIIPVGTTAERPATPINGMIRYNTTLSRYEGYNATYNQWLQLSGVTDLDGNTKILAESAPGANENILYFYADGNLTATIDSDKLFTQKFQTTGINIENNSITAINTNADINISTTGTGGVKIDNLRVRTNSITNVVSGAITEFVQSGDGYVKIQGTNGVVIPSGDLTQLPTVPETGMVRFNTFYKYVEVWNGTQWINSAGTSIGINITQAQDIGIVSALLFG